MTTQTRTLNRRTFIRNVSAGGAGLSLAFTLPAAAALLGAEDSSSGADFEPNAFVRITPEGEVIVIAKHVEMGQGTYTGLATLVAEELDADWDRVSVEGAPADVERYGNLAWGGARQGTGGSNAMRNSFMQMREAGAAARAMLVGAAADLWRVPASEITVDTGVVKHGLSARQARFAELASLAAEQPVPEKVTVGIRRNSG
jgi:isoquinoline 1-oxidoreductase beta subunit